MSTPVFVALQPIKKFKLVCSATETSLTPGKFEYSIYYQGKENES